MSTEQWLLPVAHPVDVTFIPCPPNPLCPEPATFFCFKRIWALPDQIAALNESMCCHEGVIVSGIGQAISTVIDPQILSKAPLFL